MGKKYVHNEQLMCSVISLAYEFPARRGQIRFRSGDCCDMGGCVELFEAIDPNVTAIYTFSGDEPDTGYFRERNGKWETMLQRGDVVFEDDVYKLSALSAIVPDKKYR